MDKSDVAGRLKAAMSKESLGNTELAEMCGVSLQAVTGWLTTGRVARKHYPIICKRLKISVDWLLMGNEPKQPPELPKRTQRMVDLFHRLAPDLQEKVLSIVEALAMPGSPEYKAFEKKLADKAPSVTKE